NTGVARRVADRTRLRGLRAARVPHRNQLWRVTVRVFASDLPNDRFGGGYQSLSGRWQAVGLLRTLSAVAIVNAVAGFCGRPSARTPLHGVRLLPATHAASPARRS